MGNPPLGGLQYLQISMRENSIRNSSNILLQIHHHHVLQLHSTEAPWVLDREERAREVSAAAILQHLYPCLWAKTWIYSCSS